jgi:hypothetical protein
VKAEFEELERDIYITKNEAELDNQKLRRGTRYSLSGALQGADLIV